MRIWTPARETRRRADLPPSRSSVRQSVARWSDVRLWAALGLVGVATLLGALLLGRGGDTVLVLRADRDLVAGSPPVAVSSVAVSRSLAAGYVAAGETPPGILQWPVAEGELLPRSALVPPDPTPVRRVTVPVDPQHAPADLSSGDLVDVWATPASTPGGASMDLGGRNIAPELVLDRVLVTGVSTEGAGFGGGWGVELAVPQDDVARAVSAGRSAVIDLVSVPADDIPDPTGRVTS
jgi:hypothetical protein